MKIHKLLFILLYCLLWQSTIFAQVEETQDTTSRVNVIYSEYAEGTREDEEEIRRLAGQVELRQDSVFMSCDTATIAVIANNLNAYGNVIIQQGDSLVIFADSLDYKGNAKIAQLFGNVIFQNGEQQLFTDSLRYDLNRKVATYRSGAILSNGTTKLQSTIGYYYTESSQAFFKDSVIVIDPEFELRSDTLLFNTESKLVTFLGPTRINQNDSKIYCEGGFYDTAGKKAKFLGNPQYVKEEQIALADSIFYNGDRGEILLQGNAIFIENEKRAKADLIRYDEKNDITFLEGDALYEDENQIVDADTIVYNSSTEQFVTSGRSILRDSSQYLEADAINYIQETGLGQATGNVIWIDTTADLEIRGEILNYNEAENHVEATGGRPLLITKLDGDSLFLSADTLVSRPTDTLFSDSTRNLYAYRNVKIFKQDLQSVCDSLVFNGQDSIFTFFDDPLIWSDTSQFSADTIHMKLKNGQLDTIILRQNSFIVNSPDEILFNQIKGRNTIVEFTENEVDRMLVNGNAEFVYYIADDNKAYIAANQAVCSNMKIEFGSNEVERINCFPNPTANLVPMKEVQKAPIKLDGIGWKTNLRPKSKEDILLQNGQQKITIEGAPNLKTITSKKPEE